MILLDRYIIKQMALHFLLIVTALTSLYLLVDIFERLDNFQERGLPLALAARYFFMKIPVILDQISPVSLLLSGIITLGLLVNRRELLSLNAAGIAKYRVMIPFGIGAILCTSVALAAGQWLLPSAGMEMTRIWRQDVLGEKGVGTVRKGVTFVRGRQGIYSFRDQSKAHQVFSNFRYQEFASKDGPGISLFAQTANYDVDSWRLKNGQIRSKGANSKVEPFQETTISLPESPASFLTPIALDFGKPLFSLIRQALDSSQPDQRKSLVEAHRRLSFLLLGIPLLWLALPVILCFEMGRSGINLAFAVPISAGGSFVVWALWSGMQAMAQTAVLSTIAASWSIHCLCLAGGAIIMARRQ
ncbi:MAG: LptF/LptG family permease [Proteobacteria bacterium]|nr:LptF/LptG family permease [Pseudomonadota bacterium]